MSGNGDRLLIDIDEVANQVANLQVQNPLASPNGVRSATINFTPGFQEKFPKQIREIRDILQQILASNLGKINLFSSYSLEQMREKIFTDKYLLTSNELNVLNLILSKKD